jgi:hypothetical protein
VFEADETKYRQAFDDIAENALGMQQSLKVMFDTRKLLNRAVAKSLELPLLKGRVDIENDRVLGQNKHWLPAKSVRDILRHLHTDTITGRITGKRERDLTEESVYERMKLFTRCLTAGFSQLQELMNGMLSAPDLRKVSVLGSPVFIRVLANAYNQLTSPPHNWTLGQIEQYFETLADHTATPFKNDSIWVRGEPTAFFVGMSSPEPRNQQLRKEVDLILDWAIGTPRGGVVYLAGGDETTHGAMVVEEGVPQASAAA